MANVLIVDDSKTSRGILKNILENHGHTVVGEASDGIEGVAKYKELSPDIVTIDITMPQMDGIETLKLIKQMDPFAKVIMVTAAGQNSKVVDSIINGAMEFLTKPYEIDKITEVIDKAVSFQMGSSAD